MDNELGRLLAEWPAAAGASEVIDGRSGARLAADELAGTASAWAGATPAIAAGTPIALLANDPLTFISAYVGLLAGGGTVFPLDPRSGTEALASRLAAFGVRAAVTDSAAGAQAARAAGCAITTVSPTGLPEPPAHSRPAGLAEAPYEPSSVVLCTSGTTGAPKGVPLTADRLLTAARAVAEHHQLTGSERCFNPLPLYFVNAQVVAVLSTLVAGASLIVERGFHRHGFWERVESTQATWLNAVPAILRILADGPAPTPRLAGRLRFARSASAPLPEATLRRFEQRCGVGVLETYGMTEAASQITTNPLERHARRPGSVGFGCGVEVRVASGGEQPAGPDEPGSVQIRGDAIIDHYLLPGEPVTTRPALRDGWLVTGDLGYLDDEGYLSLVGRADDVINRGGHKVYPREIEEVLLRHDEVVEAVAVGETHETLGQVPVAYVAVPDPAGDAGAVEAGLAQACERALPRHKRPERIVVGAELPTGPTGKVQRRLLRTPAGGAR